MADEFVVYRQYTVTSVALGHTVAVDMRYLVVAVCVHYVLLNIELVGIAIHRSVWVLGLDILVVGLRMVLELDMVDLHKDCLVDLHKDF